MCSPRATSRTSVVGAERRRLSRGGCFPRGASGETLTDADDLVHDTQYVALILPSVTRRSTYVRYFVFFVNVPSGGATSIPIRVSADADELPDDEPEATEHMMLRFARP